MTQETNVRPIDLARETLKLLSMEVSDLVESGTFFTINDAIMETMYRNETHRQFKTYRQWKSEGFQVRKGEKAFLLWARPKDHKKGKKVEKPQPEEKEDEVTKLYKYFPLAYLFSNAQVDPITNNKPESTE